MQLNSPKAGGLILFALAREAKPLLRILPGFQAHPIPGGGTMRLWRDRHWWIAVSGMGMAQARSSAKKLFESLRPDWVVTAGVAGGLSPGLPRSQVVFAADPAFPFEQALTEQGALPARLISRAEIAITIGEKAALRAQTGADAVDTESDAIRAIWADSGVPTATVRAISDCWNENLPLDFNRLVDGDGQLSPVRLAVAILCRPQTIPGLIQLGRASDNAAGALATALAQLHPGRRL